MSEKRFYVDKSGDFRDTKTGNIIVDFGYSFNGMECKMILDLLNSLNDENEQLKIKLEDIALEMENTKESNDDAQYEMYKIKKENEQLKQNIEVILKYCREKGKYAMDMKEIKAHNVLQRIVNDWKGDVE